MALSSSCKLEKCLGKFGANQCQARIIGKGRTIVLGGPGQVAARLEDKAFNEELAVWPNSPVNG